VPPDFDTDNTGTPITAIDVSTQFGRRRSGKLGEHAVNNNSRYAPGEFGFDIAAQLKMQSVPARASLPPSDTSPFILGGYVTPPDFKGRYALGLNDFGQPVYEAIVDAYTVTLITTT